MEKNTHRSDQSKHQAISTIIEEDLLKMICTSPLYSIVLDEATDVSTMKQLGFVVQYL